MKDKASNVTAGRYYERRTPNARLEPIDAPPGAVPDVVICRRLADYAPAPVPPGAAVGSCTRCQAAIAFNPNGPHQDAPKICMQCARIKPLPIP